VPEDALPVFSEVVVGPVRPEVASTIAAIASAVLASALALSVAAPLEPETAEPPAVV